MFVSYSFQISKICTESVLTWDQSCCKVSDEYVHLDWLQWRKYVLAGVFYSWKVKLLGNFTNILPIIFHSYEILRHQQIKYL